jgi:hypothetical protein
VSVFLVRSYRDSSWPQYLEDLRDALQNGRDVLAPRATPVMIADFSKGYKGNGLAGRLTNHSGNDPKRRPVKRIADAGDAKVPKSRVKKVKASGFDE